MYANLIFLLLGFTVAALTQNGTTLCNCDSLRLCLNSKQQEKKAPFEKCHSVCISNSSLPNATAVEKCFTDKRTAMEALKEKKDDCFFNSTNGLCSASRNRRQVTDGNGQSNGQFNRTGGSRFGGKHGHKGSKGGRGFQGIEELKPYEECMRTCVEQSKPLSSNGTNQGREQQSWGGHGRGGFGSGHHGHGRGSMPGMKECTESEKCNVTSEGKQKASEACKSSNQSDREQRKIIEQNFCICLRGALNKNETTMACPMPSADEDRRGGSRHAGRHGWGGN